jgi:hypothetical protein
LTPGFLDDQIPGRLDGHGKSKCPIQAWAGLINDDDTEMKRYDTKGYKGLPEWSEFSKY